MPYSDCPQNNQKNSAGSEPVYHHIPYNFMGHFGDESCAGKYKLI
jgi:hypothetical protein